MSELISRASNILVQRMRAAQRKSVEAAENYSTLVLDPDPDPALADTLVAAMDELGITVEDLNKDFVNVKLARKVVIRLQTQREAERRAHEAVLEAERALNAAQFTRCPQPIERAHYELDEAIGREADAIREREALQKELAEHIHRIPRACHGRFHSVEQAMIASAQYTARLAAGSGGDAGKPAVDVDPSAGTGSATGAATAREAATRTALQPTTGGASRRIATAASETVRQMLGQTTGAS